MWSKHRKRIRWMRLLATSHTKQLESKCRVVKGYFFPQKQSLLYLLGLYFIPIVPTVNTGYHVDTITANLSSGWIGTTVGRILQERFACNAQWCSRCLWFCASFGTNWQKHELANPLKVFGGSGVLEVVEDQAAGQEGWLDLSLRSSARVVPASAYSDRRWTRIPVDFQASCPYLLDTKQITSWALARLLFNDL